MISIAISGIAGRMGRELTSAALADPAIAIVAGTEVAGSPALGTDIAVLSGHRAIGVPVTTDMRHALDKASVLVEFTVPGATVEHTRLAAELGKAVVIGTTGLAESEVEDIARAAHRVAIVMAPNMSVGVNVLLRVLPEIVRLLGEDYDVEIVETHHKGKKDAPSGTALKLAQIIAAERGHDLASVIAHGREGLAPRKAGEIGMHAVRAGANVGEHQVIFANEGEQIEIVHRAYSRQNFALGAMRAAKFVAAMPPGLYSMLDVLGRRA